MRSASEKTWSARWRESFSSRTLRPWGTGFGEVMGVMVPPSARPPLRRARRSRLLAAMSGTGNGACRLHRSSRPSTRHHVRGEGERDGAVSVANRTLIAFAPYHVLHLSCRLTMPAQQGLRGDRGGSPTGSRDRSTECREDHSVCWPMAALSRSV